MTIARNLSFLAEGVSSTGVLGATYGGTGQSSITTGDLLYGSASNTISKLTIGSTGTILRVVGGVPSWGTDYTGTVTSVAATVPSFLSISGSPITTSGTLSITYSGTALPTANGGTALTSFTSNGVLYASSSSVLTTSSGLQFDGTNLAIGTTPASWYATNSRAFQVGSSTSIFDYSASGNRQTGLLNNAYLNASGVYTYLNTDTASRYHQTGGQHYWYTAASGSGAITWTQIMQTFASGGVSIGNTTDPGAGNLRFATAGTNGIYFGSSARLDDYQQGTWTPKLSDGTNTVNLTGGYYIKVGKLVTIFVNSYNTSMAGLSTSANLFINNLPFTPTQDSLVAWNPTLYVAAQFFNMYLSAANNKIYVYRNSSTIDYTGVPLVVFGSPSNMSWFFSMSYTA